MQVSSTRKYIAVFFLLWMPLQSYASVSSMRCSSMDSSHHQAKMSSDNCHTMDESESLQTVCQQCLLCCCDMSIGLIIPFNQLSALTPILPHTINLSLFSSEQPYKPPRLSYR